MFQHIFCAASGGTVKGTFSPGALPVTAGAHFVLGALIRSGTSPLAATAANHEQSAEHHADEHAHPQAVAAGRPEHERHAGQHERDGGEGKYHFLPERGLVHMSFAAVINALWDLYAKQQGKPLWKLLADMSPQQLVSCVDFHHVTDAITPQQAIDLLTENEATKLQREQELMEAGLPAYTSSAGWMGYSDDYRRQLCRQYLNDGFKWFK